MESPEHRPCCRASGRDPAGGGALLFWRRTTTLGALITAAVMLNVVMMNFCYDVPVKLFSSHLLLMAVLLLVLDRRLVRVLVLNRTAEAVAISPHFESARLRVAARIVKVLVVGGLLITNVMNSYQIEKLYGPDAPKPPLFGLWEIHTLIEDGKERPALLADGSRWRYLDVPRFPGRASLRKIDGSRNRYRFDVDEDAGTVTLAASEDPETKTTWSYEQTTPDTVFPPLESPQGDTVPKEDMLVMNGELDGVKYHLEMKRVAIASDDFLLVNRGFHWINEIPFNR